MSTRTLKIEESKAREIYRTATGELKTILEESFGKDFFNQKITDRIKNMIDVVEEYERLYGKVSLPMNGRDKQEKSINAFYQIQIISAVLNEGWVPNFNNSSEYKYYPWFEKKASGWVFYVCGCVCGYSGVGSGAVYKTSELAEYVGKQFLDIYQDYLPQ